MQTPTVELARRTNECFVAKGRQEHLQLSYDKHRADKCCCSVKAWRIEVTKVLPSLQVYGLGLSEEFLQDFMKQTGTQPVIATKFAPLPWRFREQDVVEACK